MPSNTRDLAAETLLLMVSATLLFMGGAGLLVGLVLPKMLLGPMLVPDASLAILLIGMSLLATLCHWPWLRWGAAGALLALTAYTLAHNSLDQGVAESLITGERRMTSLSTLFLLWVSACLGGGVGSSPWRLLWRITGVGLLLFGGFVLAQLWQSDELYQPLFSSSPIAVLVFIVLLGAALLVAGWRHRAARLIPGRLTVIVGLAGVLASSLAWLLLSMHQRDSIEKQASYLLDSVQLNSEQAMTEQLQLMQRMAERLEIVSADQGQSEGLLEQDAQNYFRDTLSLIEIALADDQGRVIWSQGRNEESGDWLLSQLSKPTVQSWLSIPFERPRLLVPDNQRRSMMLMAIPVSSQSQQLLAAI
ncbi:MAG: phosphodiesterase, partial [Pseudomonadota bacterium]|nr:phosphodiesterase [Pseudomonadota bacterium]